MKEALEIGCITEGQAELYIREEVRGIKKSVNKNVYEARALGRSYCCATEGSNHYKEGGLEPMDLMIAKGIYEDFCVGNMVKYAIRFKVTRNPEDLKKVSDYSHILCGVELSKGE